MLYNLARTSLIERQPFIRVPKTVSYLSFEENKIIRNKKAFHKNLKDNFLSKLTECSMLTVTVPAYSKPYIFSPTYSMLCIFPLINTVPLIIAGIIYVHCTV
jgi:hypothetical protein